MNVAAQNRAAAALAAPLLAKEALQREFQDALAENGGLVTRGDALVVKAIREAAREVDFVASTDVVDSHYEVIDQETWDLSDYEGNPVVLYGHAAYDLPIGQCTFVAVQGGRLVCTVKFSEATQKAKEVFALVMEKTLRAVSVGFRPVNGAYEMIEGQEVWVWRNSKLKEISVVAIGANPEALAKMKSLLGGAKRSDPRAGVPAPTTNSKAGTTGEEKGTEDMKTAEQLAKELEDKAAAHAEATKKLADANVRIVEAETRAEKSVAAATIAEKALDASAAKVKELESAAKTLETEHAKACADRDAAAKRAEDSEARLIELEVDALVGVKIEPAEKEEFVELRKSNKSLFEKMVSKRADMKLGERVTAPDEKVAQKAGDIQVPGKGDTKEAIEGFNAL